MDEADCGPRPGHSRDGARIDSLPFETGQHEAAFIIVADSGWHLGLSARPRRHHERRGLEPSALHSIVGQRSLASRPRVGCLEELAGTDDAKPDYSRGLERCDEGLGRSQCRFRTSLGRFRGRRVTHAQHSSLPAKRRILAAASSWPAVLPAPKSESTLYLKPGAFCTCS